MNLDSREISAILLNLVDELTKNKKWSGEFCIQKHVFFLQDLLEIPMGYNFILYKYSPHSFDLSYKLTSLRADMLLTLDVKETFGPSYVTTDLGKNYKEVFSRKLDRYRKRMVSEIDILGSKPISDLVPLSLALYFTRRAEKQKEKQIFLDNRAWELNKRRPKITVPYAQEVVKNLDSIRERLSKDNSEELSLPNISS